MRNLSSVTWNNTHKENNFSPEGSGGWMYSYDTRVDPAEYRFLLETHVRSRLDAQLDSPQCKGASRKNFIGYRGDAKNNTADMRSGG